MSWLRKVAVLTTSRAEFGLLRPLVEALNESELESSLVVGGTHLSEAQGGTLSEIEEAGLDPDALAPFDDGVGEAARAIGKALDETAPDLLVLLGDRFETLAAASAALVRRLPVLHLHGGELSLGAIDDAARHAITKLAQLHGVSTETYRARVLQLGEEDWRVVRVGAFGLAAIRSLPDAGNATFAEGTGLGEGEPFLLVALHPETLDADPAALAEATRAGLARYDGRLLLTGCNVDPGSEILRAQLAAWVDDDPRVLFRESLGQSLFFAAMRRAAALVGNSSAGILEAPAFALPTVNVGRRQEGRVRGANVLDVEVDAEAVAAGLEHALALGASGDLAGCPNPYGEGDAPARSLELLRDAARRGRDAVLRKRFVDRG